MKHQTIFAGLFAGILSGCGMDEPVKAEQPIENTVQDYSPKGWVAKTLPELADALAAGEVTSETLVAAYLDRIEKMDRSGPRLQSIISLNSEALDQARALDAQRAAGETLGPLHGLPILLKDNIESKDKMPTTAGALALAENVTGRDSPLVEGLRGAGAIILGKTNLSQWANFRSNDSISGWSALGGQVRNPHMLDRSPCGSSSGSGAAVAASFAAGAVGTETNGSIICPSNVNGVVGFKPTVGLVAQDYIVPISSTQDTAGPMTKSVRGAAMMLTAMADGTGKTDYADALDANALAGAQIGVMRFSVGDNKDIQSRFDDALKVLEASGVTLIEIEEFSPAAENFWGKSLDVLKYEFKATLNEYLSDAPGSAVSNLEELIAFNAKNSETELALFDQSLLEASNEMGSLEDVSYTEARKAILKATREDGIDRLLAEYKLDLLISPSGPVASRIDPINGDVWPSWAGAGWMAAIAGYPHASVPMGDVHGVPIGLSFMGAAGTDADILSFAYAYEQASLLRLEPKYLNSAEERPEIDTAMMKP